MDSSKDKAFSLAKLSCPRGNRPVLRPRLFQRLDELRHASIVWISGPPGAGKTTLISSYLAERGLKNLWCQLDADDGDVATFFYYLGLAVRQAVAPADLALPSLTPEYLSGLMSFTRRYAQTIAAAIDAPAVIVLDNYEQVPEKTLLHDVVRELASSLPQGLSIFVLSRGEPPPAYARLRLHERLVVLDGRELNLTRDEASLLAQARAGTLPAAEVAIDRLMQETNGWLAGYVLLLAEGGDSTHRDANTTSQQLLFDYFATELFERFEPSAQQALLRTALLPTMTLAHAERMAGNATVGSVLAGLHRQNCFVVQRGQDEPVYEYHALFRVFLLSRAAAFIPADDWRGLQHLAADLLAETGQADAAANLYRAAENWTGLTALLLREAPALISAGRHRALTQWLDALPGDTLAHSPWLLYWRGIARLPFDPATARGIFEQAYLGFQAADDAVGSYSTWAGAMESFFFEWRDFTPADHWIAEFECLRARHPEFSSPAVELRTYWAMGTLLHRQPQHPLLPAWSDRALGMIDRSDRDLSVILGGYLIIWFLWRGETSEAGRVIARISLRIESDMSPMVRILWSCAVGLYHSVQGELEECRAAIKTGLSLAERTGLQTFDFLLCAQMARCSVIAGDLIEAETWLALMADNKAIASPINAAFHGHLQCNAAAQRGDWQQAIDHARNALALGLKSGIPFLEAHCHIDLARALLGRGDRDEWSAHIDAARWIGQTINSRVITYLCLEAEATAAFNEGADDRGRERLTQALASSHAMDGAIWLMGGPEASARLYDYALSAGIEIEHVQRMIRKRRLNHPEPAGAPESWPWPVRLYTLGRFEILCDDKPLRSSGKAQRKPLELLQTLCAFGGQAINQDRVTDALWPDAEGDAADQALRTTLHRLRKLLHNDLAVRLENRHLHLDSRFIWTDCLAFDRVAHHPRLADKATLQRALNRYRGPFLSGESAPWAMAFRDRLHANALSMAERLGDLLEQDGDWAGAVKCYLWAVDIEPVAEGLYRRLMRAYVQLGSRPEALAAYRRCQQSLLLRQGVAPSPETLALHQQLIHS